MGDDCVPPGMRCVATVWASSSRSWLSSSSGHEVRGVRPRHPLQGRRRQPVHARSCMPCGSMFRQIRAARAECGAPADGSYAPFIVLPKNVSQLAGAMTMTLSPPSSCHRGGTCAQPGRRDGGQTEGGAGHATRASTACRARACSVRFHGHDVSSWIRHGLPGQTIAGDSGRLGLHGAHVAPASRLLSAKPPWGSSDMSARRKSCHVAHRRRGQSRGRSDKAASCLVVLSHDDAQLPE